MKILCNACNEEYEVIAETSSTKLLKHDCKSFNAIMQQRRIIYIRIIKDKKREKAKLWEFNEECPECGRKSDHQIKACETGLSYCSKECAKIHVNKNFKEDE